MTNLERIEQIFTELLKVEKIEPEMELKALGLDSLDLVEVMMKLEEEFGIEFSNDEMLGFSTVADVVAEIERKLKK
ncbi:MAG: Acyl carrier protein [Tenericutes bacterium ADurb.Bin239]|jgi:acyl carrier protein|nr:MAG: Acyl carrier protein [Tenericutes bacterium ADurb.Bin239]